MIEMTLEKMESQCCKFSLFIEAMKKLQEKHTVYLLGSTVTLLLPLQKVLLLCKSLTSRVHSFSLLSCKASHTTNILHNMNICTSHIPQTQKYYNIQYKESDDTNNMKYPAFHISKYIHACLHSKIMLTISIHCVV